MKKYILFMMSVWFIQLAIFAQSRIIEVFPEQGKDIENIALALKKAADCKGRPVTGRTPLALSKAMISGPVKILRQTDFP